MLLSKTVIVKWNPKIKKHYVRLGYMFTKMNDEFIVDVNDLTKGSNVYVQVQCDYCGKIYKKRWYNYLRENLDSTIHKDTCTRCKTLKTIESNQKIYSCDNVFQLHDVKEKISKTNLQRYGVDNPAKSEIIKDKIKKINIQKYGCEVYTQTDEYKKYMKEYCLKNFGIEYMPQLNITHQKGEANPSWKGGAERNGMFRSTYQYKDWHDKVLKRDRYTCQCCERKNVPLNVHHIMNFADYIDKRYDVDNGICLCKDCHYKFHKIYGFRNTNNTQLNEFILNYGKKVC